MDAEGPSIVPVRVGLLNRAAIEDCLSTSCTLGSGSHRTGEGSQTLTGETPRVDRIDLSSNLEDLLWILLADDE